MSTQLNRFLKKSLKNLAKDLAELKTLRAGELSISERAIVTKMANGLVKTRDDVIYQCCLTGEMTQSEIAEILGLTAPRISQIYTARVESEIQEVDKLTQSFAAKSKARKAGVSAVH